MPLTEEKRKMVRFEWSVAGTDRTGRSGKFELVCHQR
jgi:hypothetical protein